MSHCRWLRALCLAGCVLLGVAAATPEGDPGNAAGRVVLLGFEGADAALVRERIAAGELPNLARLAELGTLAPLVSPPPADPVASWAALTTGRNAGETDVFGSMRCERARGRAVPRAGDIRREWRPTEQYPDNPFPEVSGTSLAALGASVSFVGFLFVLRVLLRLSVRAALLIGGLMGGVGGLAGWTVRSYLPDSIPRVASPTQADAFWREVERGGLRGVVLGAPFERQPSGPDAVESELRVLAGRGFPDARGERGSWFLYTSDPEEDAPPPRGRALGASGTVFALREIDGLATARIYGPDNFAGGDARANVPLAIERKGDEIDVTLGNTTQRLGLGDWSELYPVTFQLNPLLRVNAFARARVSFLDAQHFELLVEPLHIDAREAPFWQSPCRPASFGDELAEGIDGPFATCGFSPLDHELWGEDALLSRAELAFSQRATQLRHVLADERERFVAAFFGAPGDAAGIVGESEPAHLAAYQRMDAIVGEVLDTLGPNDVLLVCSDRGGRRPERVWHLNNWLLEEGWLAVRQGVGRGDARVLRFVDWGETRAFALGSGQIYLQRPGDVALEPDVREALLNELEAALRAVRDPASGAAPVLSVARGDALYSGPFADQAPDLVVGLAPPFALSGETWAGGIALEEAPNDAPAPAFVDARDDAPTIGVEPSRAAGVLASNRKLALEAGASANVLEVAPTVLGALGLSSDLPRPSLYRP